MNSRYKFKALLLSLLTVLTMIATIVAQAQTATEVVINFFEAVDSPDQDGLTLRMFFTLTDNIKKPVTNVQIKSATLALDAEDGGNYPAKVSRATGPLSVVLVLDASGSMRNALKRMQQAASDLVNALPEDSKIAVIRFSNTVEVVQDFTSDTDQVIKVINELKANGATCLFDATYQGIQQLVNNGVTGRRAVIAFTDGVDEDGAGKPCSKKTTSDINTLAGNRKYQVPIYAIGLRGGQAIAEADLRNISEATGGSVAIGNDVNSLFKEILEALNAQYVAEALTFPKQGERNVAVRVILDNDSIPNADTTIFTAPRDYSVKPTPTPTITPTPPPIGIAINTVRLDTSSNQFVLSVTVQNPTGIKRFRVEFVDDATNLLAKEFIFEVPPLENVTVPADELRAGRYNIKITPLDEANQAMSQPAITNFEYIPPTPTPGPGPTPTPTPEPGDFISKLGRAVGDPSRGPFVLGIIVILVIGLLLVLATLFLRRPKKDTGTGFLREMTGAVDVNQLKGYTPNWSKGGDSGSAPAPQSSPSRTPDYGHEMSGDKTNVVAYNAFPLASLYVEKSRAEATVGRTVTIDHVPFTLGRLERDLSFPEDGGVSRGHAEITFDNGTFYLTDFGSTNHSFINGVQIADNTRTAIPDGASIRLGSVTTLTFSFQRPSGPMDNEATMRF